MNIQALIVRKTETGLTSSVEKIPLAQIPVHDTLVKIEYSTLNYKDALAVSGKGKILREYPMIPGIDFAGTVEQTSSDKFKPGDRVILNGFGVGEKYWGGLSEYAYVNSDFLLKMPDGMDARKAMSIGTAGYTAALCVEELLSSGINNNSAPVVVTGATGGVGSFAIALLKQQNIVVSAVSGKAGASDYLKRLGASEIIPREQLMREAKPLETQRWGGAVDTLGGNALATILAECHSGATVTACGLAADFRLNTTVMPFILRGIRLIGIDSVYAPHQKRVKAWNRLNSPAISLMDKHIHEISLHDVPKACDEIIAGKVTGRYIVKIQ